MVTLLTLFLASSITGSIFFAIVLIAQPLLKKLRAKHRKIIYCVCALLFALPLPFFIATQKSNIETQTTFEATAPTAAIYHGGQVVSTALAQEPTVINGQQKIHTPITIPFAFTTLYLAGIVVFATISSLKYKRLRSVLLRPSTPVENEEVLVLYKQIAQKVGVKNPPILFENPHLPTPLLIGIQKPKIVLPPMEALPNDVLEYALTHELTHYKQKDLLLKQAVFMIGLFHWPNPLFHLLQKQFHQVCEQHCDEQVTNGFSFPQRKAYALSLVSIAELPHHYAVSCFAAPMNKLKKRLTMLLTPNRPKPSLIALCAFLLVTVLTSAILVGCSFSAGSALSASGSVNSSLSSSTPVTSSSSSSSISQTSSIPSSNIATSSQSNSIEGTLPAEDGFQAAYLFPVPDAIFSSRGMSEHHRGMDINAPTDTPIYAANGGTVITAGWNDSYGNYIMMNHPDGLTTLYAQCNKLLVEEGQTVKQGDKIALVGSTGNSTGPHLHLEFQKGGELLDPANYVTPPWA